MTKVDPDGLEERGGVWETKQPRRDKAFVSGVSTSANEKGTLQNNIFQPVLSE